MTLFHLGKTTKKLFNFNTEKKPKPPAVLNAVSKSLLQWVFCMGGGGLSQSLFAEELFSLPKSHSCFRTFKMTSLSFLYSIRRAHRILLRKKQKKANGNHVVNNLKVGAKLIEISRQGRRIIWNRIILFFCVALQSLGRFCLVWPLSRDDCCVLMEQVTVNNDLCL